MARPCAQNGSPLTPTHCTRLGSRRETEAGSTTSDMEKDSGKGDQGQRVKVMGRGGDSSEGQNNLEGESVRPNSPPGETWKLMMIIGVTLQTSLGVRISCRTERLIF